MVNAGKRSRCCFACRKRRVKCDLETPHCRRCTQAGRPCPGYPEVWDVVLRMQNASAEISVQARVSRVRKERIEKSGNLTATIPRSVHIAPEVFSWNKFYRDYIVDSGVASFNVLPKFYVSDSSTYLQEAIHAVTVASAARQLHQSGLMIRAWAHYGKAIATVNAALTDPVSCGNNSTLVTLFLLSFFETIVPGYFKTALMDADFRCHIHFRGTLVLLRWRAERGRDSDLDHGILAFFCHICLMSMFINYEPCDVKWSALESFAMPWATKPLLEPVIRRAVDFKREVRARVAAGHLLRIEVMSLIHDGVALSNDIEAAAIRVRVTSNTEASSRQQEAAFNDMFKVSTGITERIARSLYRIVRYNVVELILDLLGYLGDGDGNGYSYQSVPHYDPTERLQILELVCDEMAFVLRLDGKAKEERDSTGMAYRAFGTFWVMVVILFSPTAGEGRSRWAQEGLRVIGEETGFGLATWAATESFTHHSGGLPTMK